MDREYWPYRFRSAAVILLGITICALLAVYQPVQAGPLTELILFSKPNLSERYSIYAMRTDGSDLKCLANLPYSCREPYLCPTTQKVAFSLYHNNHWAIYSIDLSTQEIECLVNDRSDAHHPAWLENGRKLVFETKRWGQSEIAVLDIATRSVQRLTYNQGINRHPTVSPDGRTIAYTSWVHGVANIFALRLNKANLNDVSTWNKTWHIDPLVERRYQLTKGHYPCFEPSWSPNDERVAFTCVDYRHPFLGINSSDKTERKAWRTNCPRAQHPAWSPDGTKILYQYQHKREHSLKLFDVASQTVSDFPRQFDVAINDIVWQRCTLPWSLEEAAKSDAPIPTEVH